MPRFILLMVLLALPGACAAPAPPVITSTPAATIVETEAPAGISLLPHEHDQKAALPPEEALKPEALIGKLDTDIRHLLGTPDFSRKDPPAQLWQYRTPSCLFDIFLYRKPENSDTYTVTHIEARGLDVNRVSDRECFANVVKLRGKG